MEPFIFFTYLAVEQVITNKISGLLAEQYTNVNDKLAGEFENLYEELNQLTGDFVINEYVQKTLRNTSVNTAEKENVEKVGFLLQPKFSGSISYSR